MSTENLKKELENWRSIVKKYQAPNSLKAIIQILNSFLPFLGICFLMYISLDVSYIITLLLACLAALFLVRIFIIQHDCGHQSFFNSRSWNNVLGIIASFFSTIPYRYWSWVHNIHHSHNGQLEFRGLGDIPFMTKEEYENSSKWSKFYYRLTRNFFVQFLIIPIVYLTIRLRHTFIRTNKKNKLGRQLFLNNLIIVLVYGLLIYLIGWKNVLMIFVPILLMFIIFAFWFFYVQHQHELNYKAPKKEWDHLLASIKGSTFYKLPGWLRWFTGNIGFHHIHHLNSRIPNYRLKECADENPILSKYVNTITIRQSLKFIYCKLWDEDQKRMISFREYRRLSTAGIR